MIAAGECRALDDGDDRLTVVCSCRFKDDKDDDAQCVEIAPVLKDFFHDVHSLQYTKKGVKEPLGQLLWDLGTKTSVCLIVRPTEECHGVLSKLLSAPDWKAAFTTPMRDALMSYRGQPQLGRILLIYQKATTMPASFWPFVQYLCRNCMRAFPNLEALKQYDKLAYDPPPAADNAKETIHYQDRGCIYPWHPQWRSRGIYSGLGEEIGCECTHSFHLHNRVTGGIMAFFCHHGICWGEHIIPKAEGRKDCFVTLFTRFRKAPKLVVYDFACNLAGKPQCQ